MDLDGVIDVGVEQGCGGSLSNSGTVVLSIDPMSADVLAISDQRELLRVAAASKKLEKLVDAINGWSPALRKLSFAPNFLPFINQYCIIATCQRNIDRHCLREICEDERMSTPRS
jgi:hypothetical protein